LHNAIVRADFHGAEISVVKSKSVDTVHISGIVISETLNTFKVITRESAVLKIPKKATIFQLSFEKGDILLYGDQIIQHAGSRTSKKFKTKSSVEF